MRKFYLVDYDHNKSAKKQENLYMTAAKIALKYGQFGRRFRNCDEICIQEFWEGDDDCPGFSSFFHNIKVSVVKWYIHNRIDLSGRIWSGDFLHGIATAGTINWCKYNFPTLSWRSNPSVYELLKGCGFGGTLRHYSYKYDKNLYRWFGVPALYLKYDESSTAFMAGVLATGLLCEKDGIIYARYNKNSKEFLEKWSIPIEEEDANGRDFLVSPIWGALFSSYMPQGFSDIWLNLNHPFGENIYPPILWKTYVNNDFPTWGIPYLKSRRWIFTHYKSEKGAMKTIEKERVGRNLPELDKRVREVIHEWKQRSN